MGYELWTSRITGYGRTGTRVSELRGLFEVAITARIIQEPLKACFYNDEALIVGEELRRLGFDITGIKRDENSKIEGYVKGADLTTGRCSQYVNPISPLDLIAESTPLIKVLDVLREKMHVFVLVGDEVAGIITRADLQKPPVRILLFGLISLFEMHLTYQIRKCYPAESWVEILPESRLQMAKDLLEKRKGRNEEIDLLSCLQITDKKTLMLASEEMRDHFGFLVIKTAEQILTRVGKIRDKLAHSQDLVAGTTWEEIIDVSVAVQDMLERSDRLIEETATCGVESK